MALAGKGSRAISVDGQDYRWAYSPDSGYAIIVAQAAEGNGRKLTVRIDYDLPATPALVSTCIRQAQSHGWDPDERGPDFVCDLKANETLQPRPDLMRGS